MTALLENNGFFAASLPPKPDPATGRPRPPRAPVDPGSGNGPSETRQSHKPDPPSSQSPTLEWYKASRRRSIISGIGGFVVIGLGAGLLQGSEDWSSAWWLWLFPLAGAILIGITIRVDSCCAGADWFSNGKAWVSTYQLTSIKITTPANYRELKLVDSAGRSVEIQLMTAQENQALWDLVYNGILHSVTKGDAELNALARKALKLQPPRENLS